MMRKCTRQSNSTALQIRSRVRPNISRLMVKATRHTPLHASGQRHLSAPLNPPGLQFTNITYKTKTRVSYIRLLCIYDFTVGVRPNFRCPSGLKTKHNSKCRKSFKLKHCVLLGLNALYCSRQLLFNQTPIMLIRCQSSFPITELILQ